MCNFCLQFYHLDCIGLDISEEKAKSIGIYKCSLCEINGKTEVLYEEGIYINVLETTIN